MTFAARLPNWDRLYQVLFREPVRELPGRLEKSKIAPQLAVFLLALHRWLLNTRHWLMGGFVVGRTLALSIAFASVLHAAALSAEIKTLSARDGRITIVITGDISPGDADAFKALVKQANDGGKLVGNLRLNSTGGNLLEGVKLAEAVRYAK